MQMEEEDEEEVETVVHGGDMGWWDGRKRW